MELGQSIYSQNQGQGQPGQPDQPQDGPKPDNVVDAEFTDTDKK